MPKKNKPKVKQGRNPGTVNKKPKKIVIKPVTPGSKTTQDVQVPIV